MIKNLFIRMDKIGDLVLSLNADQWGPVQNDKNHWWISKGLEFIPELALPQRAWTSFSKNFSVTEFTACLKWLRTHKPERAVVFYAPWWVGLALFLARVPYRIGRYSQWHSYLFFNYGVRQSRSEGDKHECQYNIDLMHTAFESFEPGLRSSRAMPEPLRLKAPVLEADILKHWDLKGKSYAVVHPGMAGSALNWPVSHYVELIRSLSKKFCVAVTGSRMDRAFVDPLKQELKHAENLLWLDEKLSLKELLVVLKFSQIVVAPSTGVLHLSASLGTPSLGLYSPRRVQRPTRWGPRGAQVSTLMPEGLDPDFDWDASVMERLSPQLVEEKIFDMISGRQK